MEITWTTSTLDQSSCTDTKDNECSTTSQFILKGEAPFERKDGTSKKDHSVLEQFNRLAVAVAVKKTAFKVKNNEIFSFGLKGSLIDARRTIGKSHFGGISFRAACIKRVTNGSSAHELLLMLKWPTAEP